MNSNVFLLLGFCLALSLLACSKSETKKLAGSLDLDQNGLADLLFYSEVEIEVWFCKGVRTNGRGRGEWNEKFVIYSSEGEVINSACFEKSPYRPAEFDVIFTTGKYVYRLANLGEGKFDVPKRIGEF